MEYTNLGRTGLSRQPAVPRHHELRAEDHRGRQLRDHGPRARARHQLLRHRQRVRLEDSARASPSRSSAAGSPRAAAAATRSCSPPRCTAGWASGPTTRACPRGTSSRPARTSLRRLQTDWIDLYQMHHVSRTTPWEEIWQAMEIAGRAGQGALRRLVELRRLAPGRRRRSRPRARHFLGLVSEQCIYNLLTRHVELEVHPGRAALRHRDHPVVAAARRAAQRRDPQDRRGHRRRAPTEGRSADALAKHRAAIEAYEKLCADLGRRPGRRGAGLAARPARR